MSEQPRQTGNPKENPVVPLSDQQTIPARLTAKLRKIAEYPSIERVSVHGSPLSGILCEAADTLARQQQTMTQLRDWLWLNHGCPAAVLYGDDGERQCNALAHGPLDFKRDALEVLIGRLLTSQQQTIERLQAEANRLRQQSLIISETLRLAGIGPCTLPEGVRQLWVERDTARDEHDARPHPPELKREP